MLSMSEVQSMKFSFAKPEEFKEVSQKAMHFWVGALSPMWVPFWAASSFGVGAWALAKGLSKTGFLVGDLPLAAKWPGFLSPLPKAVEQLADMASTEVAVIEPVIAPIAEPVAEVLAATEDVAETAPETFAEVVDTSESVAEAVADVAVETVAEVSEAAPAVVEAVVEPVVAAQAEAEPVIKETVAAVQGVAEAAGAATAEAAAETVAEIAPEPTVEVAEAVEPVNAASAVLKATAPKSIAKTLAVAKPDVETPPAAPLRKPRPKKS